MSLKSADILGLSGSTHNTDLVYFEKRLKQITTTNIEETFDFVVAWVLPETFVVKIGLIKFNGRTFIAHHELLEVQEAQVPRITFLISEET